MSYTSRSARWRSGRPRESLIRCAQVYATTLAARRVSSPPNVLARWRSKAKKSLSWPMTPSMIWRLPAAQRLEASLRPRPAGVLVRGGGHQRPVPLHPKPLPLHPSEALVGQVGPVAVGGHQCLPYGPLVGGSRGQTESGDHAVGVHHQRRLEAVDPLGLGGAPAERRLTSEEPLARSPHPHDGRDEGRIQDAVYRRRIGELSGEGELQLAHLGRKGSDAPIELALRTEGGEVRAQVRGSEAPEVPLAAEAGPLREDSQGEDLRIAEHGRPTGFGWPPSVLELPPVVHEDVQ